MGHFLKKVFAVFLSEYLAKARLLKEHAATINFTDEFHNKMH